MESRKRPPVATRRFGYVIAILINIALVIIANNLLDWGWLSFLTEEFSDVLWLINLSLGVGIAANVLYIVDDSLRPKALGQIVTNLISLVVSIRMLQVFPFDFSGWETDWSWALRTLLIVAIVGTSIAIITDVVKLMRPASTTD